MNVELKKKLTYCSCYSCQFLVLFQWEVGVSGMGFLGGLVVKNPISMQETQETQIQFLGEEGPLEEGMVIHSSMHAGRIPWTEEPGRLQSMGWQKVKTEHA